MKKVLAAAVCVVLAGCSNEPAKPAPSPSAPAGGGAATGAPVGGQFSAGRSTPVADPVYPQYGNPQLDVLHYGLELAWKPDTRTLTGTATLDLRAADDLREVRLDFSGAYQIDGLTLGGATVTGSVAGSKLTVAAALHRDEQQALVVKYHGTPATVAMPSHRPDVEPLGLTVTGDGALWTMQEPFGASTWYPANDQPSDKALYDIAVTVPDGWTAIAGGTPKGHDGNVFKYASTVPVATYLTTLAVGKYTQETLAGPGGVPLTVWYRPGADDKALPYLRKSPQYVDWLAARFGPYPFDSGGVVMVPSESGMETQQMITMGLPDYGSDANFTSGFDADLLHEYAHQWFGDAVTTSNWNDLWLNEGWAEYAQFLYEYERDHQTMDSWEAWARTTDAGLRKRLGPPGKPRADSFAESNVYICPALMLHQIHKKLGDAAFFALAKDWVQQQRGTAQDRAAFIAFVNKHTGQDFTQLINAWLDSPTTPK
ncbi:M1 family metallopeptidase [Dactylosporangium matsuzakiense]|uniref:Aminopeptidase N n=1 Tax=Dactylosporangium matsuzakiense TaxID=53360 RepID=A0A9W6NRZ8_9ACTN|nr:M1 family metallopeptidase [Dactylosporangium matsuzakiense]UWZ47381.1 M1 family metallopeptidase [Dactylosporangium matsuzakiense]GLL07810.1 peptidase [Dactylosporangium matsuzakiense]